MAEADPFRLELWERAVEAAIASGDHPHMAVLAERLGSLATAEGLTQIADLSVELRARAVRRTPAVALEDPISEWMLGNVDAAMASARVADLNDDLRKRLLRWIEVYDPADGWARQIITDLLTSETWADRQAERIVVALDGVAHGQRRTVEPYRRSTDRTLADLRSLRVAWFSRLGLPTTSAVDQIVEELAALDHPDARVEAARFAVVNDLRRGRWTELMSGLDRYDRIVAEEWPAEYDAFVPLSCHILSLHPPLAGWALDAEVNTRFPRMASDRVAAELAEVMQVLRHGTNVTAAIRPAVEMCAATLMHDSAIGLRLMADVAIGDADAANERVALLKGSDGLGLPHHHRHLLDVAAAEAAVWLGDRRLADLALRALEPFAGEELGLWPIDGLFGAADPLLEQLDAVS